MKHKFRLFENNKNDVTGKPGAADDIKPVMQRVFTGMDGQRLLRYLLYDWNFFSICETPEQQAMRNYAAKFLNELGNVFDVEISAEIKMPERLVLEKFFE
jgi:hypothetical protein